MKNSIKRKPGSIVLMLMLFFFASCQKENTPVVVSNTVRTVRFVLYTEKDFSQENRNIIFSIFIRRTNNRHIFDSTFSVMKVKDIPGSANKFVFEKKIFVDANEKLGAGFLYTLENVGYSWHIEECQPGELFKEVNYSFQ